MKSEVTLATNVIPAQHGDQGSPRIIAECRVDQILEASMNGATETFPILPVEHKRPGTLAKRDWTRGILDGTGALYRNAIECGFHVCATKVNLIALYDST